MENEKKIHVTVNNYDGKEPIRVEYREGDAAAPLEVKAPEKIDMVGVISTPLDWLKSLVGTIDQTQCHIVVDRENMTIKLVVNERDYYNKAVITGKVAYTDIFQKLKINNMRECWIPAELGQFIRVNRAIFTNTETAMTLVTTLKNLKAKADVEVEKQRDPSGSRADVFRQVVQSNLPKSVRINIAIFKGTPKQEFEVEFDHYLDGRDMYLQLISPSVADSTEEYRDRCIDEVLNDIRVVAPGIAIMEL